MSCALFSAPLPFTPSSFGASAKRSGHCMVETGAPNQSIPATEGGPGPPPPLLGDPVFGNDTYSRRSISGNGGVCMTGGVWRVLGVHTLSGGAYVFFGSWRGGGKQEVNSRSEATRRPAVCCMRPLATHRRQVESGREEDQGRGQAASHA